MDEEKKSHTDTGTTPEKINESASEIAASSSLEETSSETPQPEADVVQQEATEEASVPESSESTEEREEETTSAEHITPQQLRPGMTVRIHQRIKEGEKDRVQVFQGIVIALRGSTPATKTVTIAKRSFGVYVEKIFPLASPLIEKITLVKQAKVRRAKLYYLRDYAKRLKETVVR